MFDSKARNGRLPWPTPGELDPARQNLWNEIAGGQRSVGEQAFALTDEDGRLHGPFNAMLIQPVIGNVVQQLGAAIRFGSSLTERCREIAILVVASTLDSAFERYAHEGVGRQMGLSEDELTAIRAQEPTISTFNATESVVYATTKTLLLTEDLDDTEFEQAINEIGLTQLYELITLVSFYRLIALSLRVWRTELPVLRPH